MIISGVTCMHAVLSGYFLVESCLRSITAMLATIDWCVRKFYYVHVFIVSDADSLSLVALCVLCILARDSRSKAGYSGLMSIVPVSKSLYLHCIRFDCRVTSDYSCRYSQLEHRIIEFCGPVQ